MCKGGHNYRLLLPAVASVFMLSLSKAQTCLLIALYKFDFKLLLTFKTQQSTTPVLNSIPELQQEITANIQRLAFFCAQL